VGIEWELEGLGKNDGTAFDKRYFQTKSNQGSFIIIDDIKEFFNLLVLKNNEDKDLINIKKEENNDNKNEEINNKNGENNNKDETEKNKKEKEDNTKKIEKADTFIKINNENEIKIEKKVIHNDKKKLAIIKYFGKIEGDKDGKTW
jgi:dynactin complex subunit